jgi:FMN phosphatase YigB (HAD superfamily)
MFEASRVDILSLDVFDTLLWRTVAVPTDAFVVVGRRLADLGWLAPGTTPQTFAVLRSRAETRVRRDRQRDYGDPEVTLDEIYSDIPATVVAFDDIERLMGLELEVERELTLPDLDALELANLAQTRFNARVVLVSNTYFSERQIQQLIGRPPFAAIGVERIFTSSDHRRSKDAGLFRVVSDALRVAPERILHIGDDADTDVAAATAARMHAVLFERGSSVLEPVLRAEREDPAVGNPRQGRQPVIHPARGDSGLTALRCKTVARADLAALDEPLRPYWRYGASVLGPVLSGYAAWVHERAAREGIERVHCVMREGQFLSGLINDARLDLDSPVAAEPIWLSRLAVARAAITAVDESELLTLLERRVRPTLREFASSLGLEVAQLPELRTLAENRLDDESLVRMTMDHILSRPHLVGAIRAMAAGARARLIAGLRRAVGEGTRQLVLVDLGWGGTVQHHLDRAIRAAGFDLEVLGLYLLTNTRASDRLLDEIRMDSYLGMCGVPDDTIPWINRSPEIIEQACSHDAGSVVDFTNDGRPVLDASLPPPGQGPERDAVQAGVRAYQREHLRYVRTIPDATQRLGGGAEQPLLLEILRRSVVQPTAEEAQIFAGWAHDDNFGLDTGDLLWSDSIVPLLPYLGPGDLLRTGSATAYWPFGAAALHDPWLAAATNAVANGVMREEMFSRERPGDSIEVFADTGHDFTSEHASAPSRVNAAGLSCARVVLEAPRIHRVRVDPSRSPCFARLDWIALTVSVRGSPTPERILLASDDEFSSLTYVNCWRLYDGVILAMSDDPQVVCDLSGRVSGEVYRVEIEVAMALVPLPPRLVRHAGRETVAPHMGTRWLARSLVQELVRHAHSAGGWACFRRLTVAPRQEEDDKCSRTREYSCRTSQPTTGNLIPKLAARCTSCAAASASRRVCRALPIPRSR